MVGDRPGRVGVVRVALLNGPVAFACEISHLQRKTAAVVACGRHESGKLLVDLSPYYGERRNAVAELAALYAKHDPVAVVIDPRSNAGTLLKPLRDAGVWVTEPGPQDVAVAHGEFLDLVADKQVIHLSQPPLSAAVKAAMQRNLAGAKALERAVETVDQAPLVAAELACWGFRRWEELSQPSVFVV